MKSVSRGRFGKEKAEELQTLAKNTFGSFLFVDSASLAIRQFIQQIKLLESQVFVLKCFFLCIKNAPPEVFNFWGAYQKCVSLFSNLHTLFYISFLSKLLVCTSLNARLIILFTVKEFLISICFFLRSAIFCFAF